MSETTKHQTVQDLIAYLQTLDPQAKVKVIAAYERLYDTMVSEIPLEIGENTDYTDWDSHPIFESVLTIGSI